MYHVDSIVYERDVLIAIASRYGTPPFDVSHSGGVFTTQLIERESAESRAVTRMNESVLKAFGLVRGVSHTEFILGQDGRWLFLETAARVGGAHIADLIDAATGLNMWAEWAKIEVAGGAAPYSPPASRADYAGLIVSLAREEWPDLSSFDDPEIVLRINKKHHAGVVVKSPSSPRVDQLVHSYAARFHREFMAALPPLATAHE